jgi:TolB-like protein
MGAVVTKHLEVNLFGACIVRSAGQPGYEITGAKHRALFALLATAPFGRRTRSFLQDTLWGTSCFDSGRQSLRRALSDIKAVMGADFERLLRVNNSEISLDLSEVHFIGRPGGGEFLEGLDVRDAEFNDWLRGIRQSPEQLFALFSASTQPPPKAILPTIAVLPFRLITGASEHAILGDWLAEEVCRSLSRSGLLAVISHLSARELAATQIELAQVRAALGVDYFVAGSVRVTDNRVTLDADCIDAASGRILWTRQFTGKLGDFMQAESAPVTEVVRAIGQTIASEAVRHVHGRALASLEDHHLLVAGVGLMHQLKLSSFARSRELIEEAIRRAPRAAEAHAWLAEWYVMAVFNGWTTDRARDTQMAQNSTARALDIESENSFCLTIDGVVNNNLLMRLDIAEQRFDAALERNPNEALAWLLSGVLFAYRDNGAEAVRRVETAMRRSPMDPFTYFFASLAASAYFVDGNYDRALELAQASLVKNDRHVSTLRVQIASLHYLGRTDEARDVARLLLQKQPDFSVTGYLNNHPAAAFGSVKAVSTALSASGIP